MGDSVKKVKRKLTQSPEETLKTGLKIGTGTFGDARNLQKKTTQAQEAPFRKGATSAKRDAAAQIKEQQKAELLRKVEAEDEVSRRKALAGSKGAGRRSLIKTSPTGLAQNLGG